MASMTTSEGYRLVYLCGAVFVGLGLGEEPIHPRRLLGRGAGRARERPGEKFLKTARFARGEVRCGRLPAGVEGLPGPGRDGGPARRSR